jgi:hypothetical protein
MEEEAAQIGLFSLVGGCVMKNILQKTIYSRGKQPMFGMQKRVAGRGYWTALGLASAFALSLAIGGTFWPASAPAQSRSAGPVIEVPTEIIVAPAVVTPLQIKITSSGALTQQAILMIRGLPPRVTLSEGRSFSPGVWAVPLSAVGKIEMAPAHGTSGRSDLTIELVALDGKVLANASSELYILPEGFAQEKPTAAARAKDRGNSIALTVGPLGAKPDNPAPPPAQSPAALAPTPGRLSAAEIDNARTLMRRGDENMQAGKISAARLFYQSAADAGYAPAALALGATYDSRQLAQWKVVGGQQGDPAMARKWYEKARELGAPEADRRLQALGVN